MKRALLLAVLLAGPLAAQEHPDFSGTWFLNAKLSENVESKITDVAGPDDVKGHGSFGPQGHPGLGILPVPGVGKDVDRLALRRSILAAAALLDQVEIEQTPAELKHIDSGDNVRIFYLTRDHVRTGRGDERVKCHSEWRGDKLVITQEQEGGSGRLTEVLSMLATRDQLVYGILLENDRLTKPLELTLVYDRVPK